MGIFSRKSRNEEVSQIAFVEQSNALLDRATDPNTDVHSVLEGAQSVRSRLNEVRLGKLSVQPPLSHDQLVGFEQRADTIASIAQKAVEALDASSGAASQVREEAAATFKGQGAGVKS